MKKYPKMKGVARYAAEAMGGLGKKAKKKAKKSKKKIDWTEKESTRKWSR